MKHNETYCPICSSTIKIYTTVDSLTWFISKESCSAMAWCDCCAWNCREQRQFYGRTVRQAVKAFCSYVNDIRMSRRCGMCRKFKLNDGSDFYGECSLKRVPYGNLWQPKGGLLMNDYRPSNIYNWVNCYFFERKDWSTAICDEHGYGDNCVENMEMEILKGFHLLLRYTACSK